MSPTEYMLYSPLLPEVAAGVMDPRHSVVPLHGPLKRREEDAPLATTERTGIYAAPQGPAKENFTRAT